MKKWKDIYNNTYVKVPVAMIIDAQQKHYSKELRLFLLLKLLYKNGKVKLTTGVLIELGRLTQIKARKTTIKHLNFLKEKGWIRLNSQTGFFIIGSFDMIRIENNWLNRLSFQISISNYYKIKAVTGAVIYGYLHKDFWRKVKRAKSVQIKGSTYHFKSFNFNYKERSAPVSVFGLHKMFGISHSEASRLKRLAQDAKFIKVKKNFSNEVFDESKAIYERKYFLEEKGKKIVNRKGKYRYQLIDTITPLFYFSKRKNLGT